MSRASRKRKQRSIHRQREESHRTRTRSRYFEYLPGQPPKKRIGDALVKWGARADPVRRVFYEEDDHTGENEELQQEMWMDRYDARLLLDTLPSIQSTPASPRAESPAGWSDLPSDSEDTFFLSPSEVEDFRRQKRRRTLDKAYEERLKARIAEDEDSMEEQDTWGGSDEEPDDIQKELMRRTAVHLHSSPNSAQLEMRILANHGADKRFAFLRGRWSRTWKLMKSKLRIQAEESAKETAKKNETPSSNSLGDSLAPTNEAVLSKVTTDDTSIKEARRARAKMWGETQRASPRPRACDEYSD
ncbi:hypothetical protein APHAL10511_003021 [Amanita phalloides]|nr:hypothetical protein APHAL10511_003021 [Amanita phalloides]